MKRASERVTKMITKAEFIQDTESAFRYAKEFGSLRIFQGEGKPVAVLTFPKEPLVFDRD